MSILKRISQFRRRRSDVLPTSSSDTASASSNDPYGANPSMDLGLSLIQVRIEPDSAETQAQSLLKARTIEDPVLTIGRRSGSVAAVSEGSEFSIRQVEPYTVSRRHCSIERYVDCVVVSDLGGKYGCLVNGQRIGGRPSAPKSVKLTQGRHDLLLGPRDSTIRFKLIVG